MSQEVEAVEVENRIPAGAFWRRVLAFAFDILVVLVLSVSYLSVRGGLFLKRFSDSVEYTNPAILKQLARSEFATSFSVIFFFAIFYFIVLEYIWRQATLGKIIFSLQVVSDQSRRPTLRQIAIRFFAKFLIGPLTLGLSWAAALLSNRRQAWHDRIAKTYVVLTSLEPSSSPPPEKPANSAPIEL